jgi:phosphoribosylglycinamide formyltransferase-1
MHIRKIFFSIHPCVFACLINGKRTFDQELETGISMMKSLVIFASGNGTNMQRLAEYFAGHPGILIKRVYCNNPQAYVLTRAGMLNIPILVFDRTAFYHTGTVLDQLRADDPSLIILAGFLWLIPPDILQAFPRRIINIHPALLPKYGGRGMYGMKVHEAVLAAGDPESGISIHYVNDRYDEGQVIFQAKCRIEKNDTPDSLAARIHKLEYAHYPVVIDDLLNKPY